MAFVQELTQQVVALTTEVGALTGRLVLAEQEIVRRSETQSKKGNTCGVFDQKTHCPKDLKKGSSFRAWSSRFIAWLRMDNAEVAALTSRL